MGMLGLPLPGESFKLKRGTVVLPDRRWWKFDGYTNPKTLSMLYSIGLMDLNQLRYVSVKGLDPASENFARGSFFSPALYQFTIPPQSYELAEPTTAQIVATQGGGKFVESHGSLFKDIRVSGTVGLRPRPIAVGVFSGLEMFGGPTLSVPGFIADFLKDSRGLDPNEITGFDDLIFLRNLFRAYSDIKQSEDARRIGMVWTTMRDAEAWVVEPVSFTTTRDRASPLSWRYAIQLRTLYLLDSDFGYMEDPVGFWQSLKNAINFLKKAAADIATSINQLADAVNWIANLPANLMQVIFNCASQVLAAVANLKNSILDFPKNVSKTFLQTAAAFAQQVKILFDEQYPQLPSEAGLEGSRFEGVAEPWAQYGVSQARAALTTFQRIFEGILGLDRIWEQPKQVTVTDFSKAYLNARQEPPFTAGSPLNVGNMVLPQSGEEVTVTIGDDIRGIAKRYMGDEAYWKQLVIMNNLRPPYIGASSGSGILGPGDKIVIPKVPTGTANSGVGRALNSDAALEAQSQIMQRYGRDIRLGGSTSNPSLSDLSVNARGDLELIEGVPNVEQAVMIKFSTEQGELATHPEFGARYPLGTKVTQTTLQEYSINTRRTILSDPRVANIAGLQIMAEGDKVITKAKLDLTDSDIQLPIMFAVRS